MLSSSIILYAALLAPAHAQLTCLNWALISPIAGLFCHFEPAPFQKAKDESSKVVKEAIDSTKNLVEFDLTHNPVAVTYNFVKNVKEGGLTQGEGYLQNTTTDFRDVFVGFGKETTNQVVQLYGLAHWNDISLCLIKNAVKGSARRKSKRAGKMAAEEGLAIVEKCVEEKIHGLSRPAVFNVTAPSEQIGSTISNLAGLLLPVGVEEGAATAASKEAVDLALPGSEEGGRVYKLVDGRAEHFSNTEEAEATAEQMADPDWIGDHCKVCPAPSLGSIARTRRHLSKRGAFSLSFCCGLRKLETSDLPETVEVFRPDSTVENGKAPRLDITAGKVEDPRFIDHLPESQLVPANREMRLPDQAGEMEKILADLDSKFTTLVAWPKDLVELQGSDTILPRMRRFFESKEAKISASVQNRRGVLMLNGDFPAGLNIQEPESIRAGIKIAEKDCLELYGRMMNLTPNQMERLKISTRFWYMPPNPAAETIIDTNRMCYDRGLAQFITSDVNGIVFRQVQDGSYSSLAAVPKGFNVLRGIDATRPRPGQLPGPSAIFSKFFGREASQKGAVHMKITIDRLKPLITAAAD